jgi:hypothetical protein
VNPFFLAVLGPTKDRGVSMELLNYGIFDVHVLGPFQFILQTFPCSTDNAVVVDVGANVGFFSFFALSMKCRAVIFEPQQAVGDAIMATLCIDSSNRNKIDFHRVPVSTSREVIFPVSEHEKNNIGSLGSGFCKGNRICEKRPAVQLDRIFAAVKHRKKIRLLKIDTEGYDADVILSARSLLQQKLIENILFEYTPHHLGLEANVAALQLLLSLGYQLAELPYVPPNSLKNFTHPFSRNINLFRNPSEAFLRNFTEVLIVGSVNFQTDIWASLNIATIERYMNMNAN